MHLVFFIAIDSIIMLFPNYPNRREPN